MEILAYLAVLRRHWRVLVLLPIVAGLVATLASFALSPKYVGASKIQVLVEQIEPGTLKLRSENELGELTVNVRDASEVINTQIIEMLDRREAAEEIVRRLRLDEKDPNADLMTRVRDQLSRLKRIVWDVLRYLEYREKGPFEGTVDKVQAAIEAEPMTGSFVIEVTAKANKPELAAAIANTAVDILMEDSGEMAADLARQKREYLEQQLDVAEQRLTAAQQSLVEYRIESGLVALPEQARLGVQIAEQIRASIREIDTEIAHSQTLLIVLADQIYETPAEVLSTQTVSGVITQGVTTDITSTEKTDTDASGGQSGMTSTDGSSSSSSDSSSSSTTPRPDSDSSSASSSSGSSTSSTTTQLDSDSYSSSSSSGSSSSYGISLLDSDSHSSSVVRNPNPVFLGLETARLETERAIPALEAKRAALVEELEALEVANTELISNDHQMTVLYTQVSLADEQYRKITNDLYDARLEEARPTRPVRILERAVAPLYPESPMRGLYAGGAVALGLLVALVLAFLLDYCDLSIKTVGEAEVALNMRSLGEVLPPRRERAPSYRNPGQRG